MIQVYVYKCQCCGNLIEQAKNVEDRDETPICLDTRRTGDACCSWTKRIYTPPTFTAHMQKDLTANRIYHGDRDDVRRQQKADDAAYEKMTAGWDTSKPKTRSMDDILSSGIVQAASSSKEAVMQWRADNIAADAEPVNG